MKQRRNERSKTDYGPVAFFKQSYNSNSFVSGVIIEAGAKPPEFPIIPIAPGYDKPLPIEKK